MWPVEMLPPPNATALLQVLQAKSTEGHARGGYDPEVLKELRTAPDLTPRATKVMARSLGRAMSTLVVQERQRLQRLLGHMAAAAAVTPLGLLHMRLLQHWLHGRVPRWAWQSGTLRVQVTPACRQTFTPWSDLSFLRAGVPL